MKYLPVKYVAAMPGLFRMDGRELVIRDGSKASAKAKELVETTALNFFRNNYLARKLKSLKIVLDDGRQALFGEIGVYDEEHRLVAIHVNEVDRKLLATGESAAFAELNELIAHEASHALMAEISEVARLEEAINERIRNSVMKTAAELTALASKGEKAKEVLAVMKETTAVFLSKLKYEGIATFIGWMTAGRISYDNAAFAKLYSSAMEDAKTYLEVYRELLNEYEKAIISPKETERTVQLFMRLLRIRPHDIGLHMTYALVLYTERIDNIHEFLIQLSQMTPYAFVKRYESAVEKHGVKPVISLSSRKGVLDYSAILKLFYGLERRLR